jgi:stearoyl-CoA desaturase (delta-9 desaturase)
VRQGFYWWEIDITYYLLVLMSWCGIIRDLRPVPEHIINSDRVAVRKTAKTSSDGSQGLVRK